MASRPVIPAITIDNTHLPDVQPTQENSPALATRSPSHQRSPSDPHYLHPSGTPALQDEPSSPTGSISSANFKTTVALRENQPNAESGRGTLALLAPETSRHARKNSASSLISAEGTEPDYGAHPTSPSALSATTTVAVVPTPRDKTKFSHADTSQNPNEKTEKAEHEDTRPAEIEDVTDPAPFAWRPKALAEMAENKSMDTLTQMGGPEKLMEGLGTDPSKGLSAHSTGEGTGGGPGPFGASIEERKRVYGTNQMPVQRSKSLLQLMWLALQDKVLVRIPARVPTGHSPLNPFYRFYSASPP